MLIPWYLLSSKAHVYLSCYTPLYQSSLHISFTYHLSSIRVPTHRYDHNLSRCAVRVSPAPSAITKETPERGINMKACLVVSASLCHSLSERLLIHLSTFRVWQGRMKSRGENRESQEQWRTFCLSEKYLAVRNTFRPNCFWQSDSQLSSWIMRNERTDWLNNELSDWLSN